MGKPDDRIQYLKGIGPAKAKLFEALGIRTVEDLLYHYPRAYEDRTRMVKVGELEVDCPACFRAMVMNTPRTHLIRKGLELTKVTVADHTARLNLTFFNQRHSAEQLMRGQEYIFYGTVTGDFNGYGMTNPAWEPPEREPVVTRRILPVYPLTAGLSNNTVAKAVAQALDTYGPPPELLPAEVRQRYDILPAQQAYGIIHRPQTQQELAQARKRLVFEEFFLFSAGLALMRAKRTGAHTAPWDSGEMGRFYDALPFRLTGAQLRAIGDILRDFGSGKPMNRLLQGDVGSGKTMVAAAAAFCAGTNGFQTALMAPTEILAEQHARSLEKLLAPLGLPCVLLTGSMGASAKRQAREQLASGTPLLAVGTHALVSESTEFGKLGLVITDEQHRFGVGQRARLSAKGRDPHLLVMSATPIPRTLSLIVYGDLDASILDELPPGRQKIDTFLLNDRYRARLNGFIRREVEAGHQCYVVCPTVEGKEGDLSSLKAAEDWAQALQQKVFPDFAISLVHGRKSPQEKEEAMAAFARGESQILVATTVIEVGVDVPNATVMVIEDAERFGLSQLHQLRGRVGRGSAKSWCFLMSNTRSVETQTRLKTLCATTDGFVIAEEDLKLRGPGDFFGHRQHGLPAFKAASLTTDLDLLKQAQEAAALWIEHQGHLDTPETRLIWERVQRLLVESDVSLN